MIPHLRAIPSVGPVDFMEPTPCGGCQKDIAAGEKITKYRRSWWHSDCATRDVNAGNPVAAWIALGHDLARNPRSYRVGETRAIVGALLGMVHDPDVEMYSDEADLA